MGITLKNNKSVTKNMTIKGDDGVGIKTITSGTPVVTEEKTTTPITVTLTDETTQNFNVEAKNGSGAGNALTKPTTAPSATQIVAVDNTNTQTMLNIGDGLSVENGSLKASGGTGETGGKLYYKNINLFFNNSSVTGFEDIQSIDIYFYESTDFTYTKYNLDSLYEKIDYAICRTQLTEEAVAQGKGKWFFGCKPSINEFEFFGFGDSLPINTGYLLLREIDGINVSMRCEVKEV